MKKLPLIFAALLIGVLTAQADTLVTTRPVGTDSVDWSQLGGIYATIPDPVNFTTTDGVGGLGSYGSGGTGWLLQQSTTWAGNFAPSDWLNYNRVNGPITLDFSSGYTEIGAQIEAEDYGLFLAKICDSNGACFLEDGDSEFTSDNTAIYIGISSSTPITSVTFSLTCCDDTGDLAINQVTLIGMPATPEPSSLLLLGTGLMGFAGAVRRKLAKN